MNSKYLSLAVLACYARIALKDCDILVRDGLSGTAAVNDMSIMAGNTDLTIQTVALNTTDTDAVPVGARFTVAGETGLPVHTVTQVTGNPTTSITFSPPLAAGVVNMAVITFTSQQIEVKIGDGNLTYTESNEYNYELDRQRLDTVTEGDEQPMEVSIDAVYEAITTGTNETIAFMDAIKQRGGAAGWVSSSSDPCEPYAVDLVVIHRPPCGTKQAERTVFPDFRSESREVDFSESSISVSGRCNAVEPIVDRGNY